MSDIDGEIFSSSGQSPTTPAVGITPAKDSNARPHGDMLKMMNPTPNGYSSVPNHKPKSEGQDVVKKHHDGKNSIDHHKHSSDHVKKKDEESSKHKSSHSKSKDSSKEGKSEHREGHSEKEKKHKDSSHKDSSKSKDGGNKHSDHSKHSSSVKKEDKHKSDSIKKEHHNSDGKPKTDNFKENEKVKDSSSKEGKSKEHKDKHKDKHRDKEHKEKHKDKSSSDKPKERSDKPKEKSDKLKEKSDKPKEKSDKPKEKSDKPKEKSDRPKDESHEKHKEKHKDKHGEKHKEKHKHGEKHKDKVKIKEEHEKSMKCSPAKDLPSEKLYIKEETMSDDDIPLAERHASILANKSIKREAEDSEDEPISSRMEKKVKSEKKKKKPESGDEDYEMEEKPKKRKKPSSDDDDDYDTKKATKKVKKEKTALKVKKQEPVIKRETGTSATPKKRGKKEEESEDVWKWWEEEKLEDGVKWKTLQHNGPVFAPAYERVPKDVKFYYDGKHMPLSELTEEVAGFYGRMLDHDYTGKKVFNTNFFKDWKKVMTPKEKETITDLGKCNFKDFDVYYKMKSEERKNRSKEEKNAEKAENEELTKKYGFCIIDGHKQKIGNFKIEPPGLFRGRGEHPKMGMLKRRVEAEDISINIGKEATAPEPPPGHKWKEVRHDNTVSWLASWSENILGSTKYIMLNPSSKLKGEKDWQKYETARKLKAHANRIREEYQRDFKSKEMKVRQRAVALYFIDKLALRAGNEKDEDTADTVGCCSLRFEHITLDEEKDGQEFVVTFDFLGKDSIRYFNSVAVDKRVYKNIKLFMENKHKGDDLFDRLNTAILNKYLNDLMEGLTAKVFRTYNASKTLQEQLDLLTKEEMSLPEKILAYNRANRAVAILCNHQRAVPKGFSKSMENLKTKMDEKESQIQDCKKELKSAKAAAKNGGSKEKILYDKKKKRLAQLEEQLKKLEVQATDREENKQIALGTSKLNYLDPRISVAWCKKWEVPIEKIYNRTQRDKFRWAIEMAGPDYKF